jgi:hypothetical protein
MNYYYYYICCGHKARNITINIISISQVRLLTFNIDLITSVTSVENSTGSVISCYMNFRTSAAFSRITFQLYMPSNDTSKLAFNAIFHE